MKYIKSFNSLYETRETHDLFDGKKKKVYFEAIHILGGGEPKTFRQHGILRSYKLQKRDDRKFYTLGIDIMSSDPIDEEEREFIILTYDTTYDMFTRADFNLLKNIDDRLKFSWSLKVTPLNEETSIIFDSYLKDPQIKLEAEI